MGTAGQVILGVAGLAVGSIFGPQGAAIGFSIGYTLGGIIDPPTVQGPTLGEASVQTSRDDIPIPVVWGVKAVVGNIIIQNPIYRITREVSSGGKGGGPTTTETRAYRTFGIGVCRSFYGPIEGVTRIWENEKLVYDVRENPAIPATETQAFADGITIYLGGEDQMPEPDFDEVHGVLNPAFRGLAWVAFHDKDITDFGQSIPTYRFEVNAGDGYLATSQTYPLEQIDNADIGFTFFENRDISPPLEGSDIGFTLISAEFNNIKKTYSLDESTDADFAFVSGVLKQVKKYHTVDPESGDGSFTFVSGELTQVRISYSVEPEAADGSFTFVSGTLNQV